MSTNSDWPPEGTRVRIVGTKLDGRVGWIDNAGLEYPSYLRWVRLDNNPTRWPVERHEIEVIDDR